MATTTLDLGWDILIGMPVFTSDNRRLGVVAEADPYGLIVEEGLLFRHSYAVSLRDVDRCEDGAVHLALRMDEVREPHPAS